MRYCMWSLKSQQPQYNQLLLIDVYTKTIIATINPSYAYPDKWFSEIHIHKPGDTHRYSAYYESQNIAQQNISDMIRDYGYLMVTDKHKTFI